MSDNILEVTELRNSVGITINEFDSELKQLEASAIKQLKLCGISHKKIKKEDSFIVTTILSYVKANFRFTDKEIALRFQDIFEKNKNYMRSTIEYTTESSEENE